MPPGDLVISPATVPDHLEIGSLQKIPGTGRGSTRRVESTGGGEHQGCIHETVGEEGSKESGPGLGHQCGDLVILRQSSKQLKPRFKRQALEVHTGFEFAFHPQDERFDAAIAKGPQAIRMTVRRLLARGQKHPTGPLIEDATLHRHPEDRIDDHPMGDAPGSRGSRIESRIVCEDRADSGQDRIDSASFPMHERVGPRP